MFHLHESRKMLQLLKERKLNLRDFAVLFAMMSCCDCNTGKIRFIMKTLSDEIGITNTNFSACVARLKKNKVVASIVEDNGDKYYLVNPYLFSTGSKKRWGLHLQKFMSVFI